MAKGKYNPLDDLEEKDDDLSLDKPFVVVPIKKQAERRSLWRITTKDGKVLFEGKMIAVIIHLTYRKLFDDRIKLKLFRHVSGDFEEAGLTRYRFTDAETKKNAKAVEEFYQQILKTLAELEKAEKKIPLEHERRFLVNLEKLPFDFKEYPKASIFQGYLKNQAGVRIRREYKDEKSIYTKTIKSGEGVSRQEDEQVISEEEFNILLGQIEFFLKKERYFIPWERIEIQLNIFCPPLKDYVQIEVEFNTHDGAVNFVPPKWFGPEVTDDHRHDNYSLAKDGIPV